MTTTTTQQQQRAASPSAAPTQSRADGDSGDLPRDLAATDTTTEFSSDGAPAASTPDDLILPIAQGSGCPPDSTWKFCSLDGRPGRQEAEADTNSPPPTLPQLFAVEPIMLGVDEAGRGPVMGPMVYAIAFAPISRIDVIRKTGVDDSKKLTEADRDSLFARFTDEDHSEWMGWSVTAISPKEISEGMLRKSKYNLNQQAHDTTIDLIRNVIRRGVCVREVYVDTVGKEKPYQELLERHFPGIAITVASKADSKFPIVSAASIFAKVIRDCVVRRWRFTEDDFLRESISRTFGSGYPSDPNTRKWLKENLDPVFGYPSIIRFSWSTAAKMMQDRGIPVHWHDDEPVDKKITSYFMSDSIARKKKPVTKSASSDLQSDEEEDSPQGNNNNAIDEDDSGDDGMADNTGDEFDANDNEDEEDVGKGLRRKRGRSDRLGGNDSGSRKKRAGGQATVRGGKRDEKTNQRSTRQDSPDPAEDDNCARAFAGGEARLRREAHAAMCIARATSLQVDSDRTPLLKGLGVRRVTRFSWIV